MQVQKADTRKQRLAVSRKLFLRKGFRGTTTREIAAAAGVTPGNLYHYFSSKDQIFCTLVSPAMQALEQMLDENHGVNGSDVLKLRDERFCAETTEEYATLLRRHRMHLRLLLFNAQGSSLEDYKEYYVDKSTTKVLAWLERMQAEHPEMKGHVSDFFIHLNTVWMFALLEEVLMHNLPEEEMRAVISDYVRFEILGWKKMFNL